MEFESHRQPPTEWIPWMDSWVADMRVHGNTHNTIESWWYQIGHLARYTGKPPQDMTSEDIIAWLGRGVSLAAMRTNRNAATSFFGWATRSGLTDDDPMERVPSIKRERKKQLPASPEALEDGLKCADPKIRLMILLASDAGMRRSEIAQAHTKDIVNDLLGQSLIVHGKGRKDRIVPLSTNLAHEIAKLPAGWFFPGEGENGHICGDTVYRLIRKTTGSAPHSFRRKFATDIWKATGDVLKVQELLGHESLATTQMYLFSTQDDLRLAVDALERYRIKQ